MIAELRVADQLLRVVLVFGVPWGESYIYVPICGPYQIWRFDKAQNNSRWDLKRFKTYIFVIFLLFVKEIYERQWGFFQIVNVNCIMLFDLVMSNIIKPYTRMFQNIECGTDRVEQSVSCTNVPHLQITPAKYKNENKQTNTQTKGILSDFLWC